MRTPSFRQARFDHMDTTVRVGDDRVSLHQQVRETVGVSPFKTTTNHVVVYLDGDAEEITLANRETWARETVSFDEWHSDQRTYEPLTGTDGTPVWGY